MVTINKYKGRSALDLIIKALVCDDCVMLRTIILYQNSPNFHEKDFLETPCKSSLEIYKVYKIFCQSIIDSLTNEAISKFQNKYKLSLF